MYKKALVGFTSKNTITVKNCQNPFVLERLIYPGWRGSSIDVKADPGHSNNKAGGYVDLGRRTRWSVSVSQHCVAVKLKRTFIICRISKPGGKLGHYKPIVDACIEHVFVNLY